MDSVASDNNMESEAEAQFNEVYVPEIKVEYDSDTADCEIEKKWNADPLTEGTIETEDFMPVVKEEEAEVKFESTECVDIFTTKLEEEFIAGYSDEDVSRVSSGASSPSSNSGSIIIPVPQNSQHEQVQQTPYLQDVSSSSDFYGSGELSSQLTNTEQLQSGRRHTCSICFKSFPKRTRLTKHERCHTNERPYTCNICNKSFTQTGHLSTHIRTHTNERPYVCSICNKSFKSSGHLSNHIRTHTNERPYTCKTCNKSFKESGALTTHMRSHTKERPYSCKICNKSFTWSGNLSQHQRVHTNERPYTCNICNKSFSQGGTLNKHKRTHLNEYAT